MKRIIGVLAISALLLSAGVSWAQNPAIRKKMIGTWEMKDEGHLLRMQLHPDGVVNYHYFNFGTRAMADRNGQWSVEKDIPGDPDGTPVMFDGSAEGVKFSGRTMILTRQPASATIVEHWHRAN
jgi:hypothetical protein